MSHLRTLVLRSVVGALYLAIEAVLVFVLWIRHRYSVDYTAAWHSAVPLPTRLATAWQWIPMIMLVTATSGFATWRLVRRSPAREYALAGLGILLAVTGVFTLWALWIPVNGDRLIPFLPNVGP
jgi:hypothetical protein